MSKKLLLWLATTVVIFLSGCNAFSSAPYSVIRVSDGDTLTVVDAKVTDIHVRLVCVDAQEVPNSTK